MENDTIFKHYKNSNLNIIPLISEGEKKYISFVDQLIMEL